MWFSIINRSFWGSPIHGNHHIPLSLRFLVLTPHTSYRLITLWFYLHLRNLLLYALGPSIVCSLITTSRLWPKPAKDVYSCGPTCKFVLLFQQVVQWQPKSGIRAITVAGWWFGCHFLFSQYLGNVILPIDELIFFQVGVAEPPTR